MVYSPSPLIRTRYISAKDTFDQMLMIFSVDTEVVSLQLPDYHEIIEHPMDFGTLRKKLDEGLYSNLEELEVGNRLPS